MSAARTLSDNIVFPCVTNSGIFNKLEAGGVEPPSEKRYAAEPTCLSQFVWFASRAWNEQETRPTSPMVLAEALRTERLRPAHCMTPLAGPVSKARGSVRLIN
jgi:hypothetical protein